MKEHTVSNDRGSAVPIVIGTGDKAPVLRMAATQTWDGGDVEITGFYSAIDGKVVVQIDAGVNADFRVDVNDGNLAVIREGGDVVELEQAPGRVPVLVLSIVFRGGEAVTVHRTQEGVEQELDKWVTDWWQREMCDVRMPTEREARVEEYFERMADVESYSLAWTVVQD